MKLKVSSLFTLLLFNIAMENDPFIDDVPVKNVIFHSYVKEPKRNPNMVKHV